QPPVEPCGDDLDLHAAVAVVGQVLRDLAAVGADRDDDRPRRGVVDRDRARQEHGAPLAAQRDAHLVGPVGDDLALVVAPVPDEASDALTGGEVAVLDERADQRAALVDDVDRHVIGLLEPEGHRRAVLAPVPVGAEDRDAPEHLDDRRLVLEPLGEEERAEGGRDQRAEHRRRRPRHGPISTSDALGTAIADSPSPRAWVSARRITPRWQTTSAGSSPARTSARPACTRSPCWANDSPPGKANAGSASTKRRKPSGSSAWTWSNERSVQSPQSVSAKRASGRGSIASSSPTIRAVSSARSSGEHHSAPQSRAAASRASARACSRPVSSSGTGRWPWKRRAWL